MGLSGSAVQVLVKIGLLVVARMLKKIQLPDVIPDVLSTILKYGQVF